MKKYLFLVLSCVLPVLTGCEKKQQTPWYEQMAVYQIFVKSFYDSNNDGQGDLKGVEQKLDYIKSLGVNAIYFNPIADALQDDTRLRSHLGYEILDFKKVLPAYGTTEQFKSLIAEAHKRDIHIIFDFITTVISVEHPFFKDVRNNPKSPYRDWFIIRDEIPGGPWMNFNDYSNQFASKPWKLLPTGGYYYTLWGASPMLNYHNPKVQEYILSVIDYWMELGVDGYRIDAAKHLFMNGPGQENQFHQPENFEFFRKLRKHITAKFGAEKVLLAEVLPVPNDHKYVYPNREMFDAMVDYSMVATLYPNSEIAFDDLLLPKLFHNYFDDPNEFKATKLQDRILYFADQDITRISDRIENVTDDQLKLIGSLLIFTPTHFKLFEGEELGLKKVENLASDFYDWKNSSLSIFAWDDSPYGGFSTHKPLMPASVNYKTKNVKAQEKDPRSILSEYRRMIKLKNQYPDLFYKGKRISIDVNDQIYAFFITNEKHTALVVSNFDTQKTQSAAFSVKATKIKQIFGESTNYTFENNVLFINGLESYKTNVYLFDDLTSQNFNLGDVTAYPVKNLEYGLEYKVSEKTLFKRSNYWKTDVLRIFKNQGTVSVQFYRPEYDGERVQVGNFDLNTTDRDIFIPMIEETEAVVVSVNAEFSFEEVKDFNDFYFKTYAYNPQNPTLKKFSSFADENFWHFKIDKEGYALPSNSGLDYCILINSGHANKIDANYASIYGLPTVFTDEYFDQAIFLERHKHFASYVTNIERKRPMGVFNSASILSFETEQAYYAMVPKTLLRSNEIKAAPFIWSAMGKWGDTPPAVGPVVERLTTNPTKNYKADKVEDFLELKK